MTRRLTRLLSAVAVVTLTATAAAVPGAAYAIDHSKGTPGFCPAATGVTVVVDFQQLGGTTIVRCNPRSTRGTGLDALKGAGFQIAGTQRWGEAFVCRVENRPSAVEELPIEGKPGYQESCVDTPPAAGYWSYWHAGNNCPWVYSKWGVKNRDFIAGGFEGWSFSLNATADANPVPRIAAVRPGTSGRACNAVAEPEPSSGNPDEQQPVRPGTGDQPAQPGPAARAGNSPSPGVTGTALPPPRPRPSVTPTAVDPAGNVAFTGGEEAADVNEVIRKQSGASRYAPWVAAGLVVALLVATVLTARRRSRARKA